ncbi:MAG: histidine phosphatase family protein [Burkholderiaceae bacterium]
MSSPLAQPVLAAHGRHALWLARHAQPLVAPGLCYGASDVPACPDATQQAALALAQALPPCLTVLSSPLQRCTLLAHALLGLRPDLTLTLDPRLAEMDFGTWEGRRWDDIGAGEFQSWMRDFADHAPGGGESVAAFMQRVAQAWDSAGQAPALWLTHAGVIRAVQLIANGQRRISQASEWPQTPVEFGQWLVLQPSQKPAPGT